MTDEQVKKDKDDKKEKESPELKEELTDEELSGLSGGGKVTICDSGESPGSPALG